MMFDVSSHLKEYFREEIVKRLGHADPTPQNVKEIVEETYKDFIENYGPEFEVVIDEEDSKIDLLITTKRLIARFGQTRSG